MLASLRTSGRRVGSGIRGSVDRGLDSLEDVTDLGERARRAWQAVTPLGRTVAVVGVGAWTGGWLLGWLELMIVAAACLLLLVVAVGFVVGRLSLRTEVALDPARITAGDTSAGSITVTNGSTRRSSFLEVALPVGDGALSFAVRSLGPGENVEELFLVPTERRGVIPVGPATSVRGDPVGLLRRAASASDRDELIVHPKTVALAPFGTGLLRDLEGLTTNDLSSSDLAFHALREYVPGDARRSIHWRSSAKAGKLLVRQFLDTRRSTLCVVVDGQASGYGDPDEFETALEVAGSIAMRACRDELPAVVAAADQAATGSVPHVLLDALARAELGRTPADLASLASRAVDQGGDISVALVVSGSARRAEDLRRAAARFPPDVRVVTVQVVPGERPSLRTGGRGAVLQLATSAELPGLFRAEGAA